MHLLTTHSTNSMTMRISKNRNIQEVQAEFNQHFPYLKIEFFRPKKDKGDKPTNINLIRTPQTLEATGMKQEDGEMSIEPTMTVAEMETTLLKQFGLNSQVFRKSGKLWLETTMTDQWTLQQQNEHGREISAPSKRDTPFSARDFELDRGED